MRTAIQISTIMLIAAAVAACASQPSQPVLSTQGSTVVQTAQVINVRDITVSGGRPSGVGAFAGTLLGGVAGSRIGSGYGSAAAGIGGAIAGGMAGQHIEQSGKIEKTVEVTVRLENGETRTYNVAPGSAFRVGDTVNVTSNGGITRITR
ncbi:MAG TPA: glycine zipper 2TM domain-containing protein [Noviherbaspirillum sp.]|nr:glycine zipper 2TM domain-containing protein [Noviherbaspirillum sp.]